MVRLRIKEIAQAKGISQGQLSRRANVTPRVISRIFHDPHPNIELHTLERIAGVLGVPVHELIENGGEGEEDDRG